MTLKLLPFNYTVGYCSPLQDDFGGRDHQALDSDVCLPHDMSDLPLPYDGTPPPEENPWPAAGPSDPLDRALDDYEPAVPDHVKSLMGRMSKGKVYLLEESPAIIHTDGDERIRRDPVSQHGPTYNAVGGTNSD